MIFCHTPKEHIVLKANSKVVIVDLYVTEDYSSRVGKLLNQTPFHFLSLKSYVSYLYHC